MLQYFSVTGNAVFMCLSFVQPEQDRPHFLTVWLLNQEWASTEKLKSVHIQGYLCISISISLHIHIFKTSDTLTNNYNPQCVCLW